MNEIFIGIDIGKRLHAAVVLADGVFQKPFSFSQTAQGYQAFEKWLGEKFACRQAVIGLEPTGKYFKHLAGHLKNKGFRIRIIPGLYTSRAKYLLNNSSLKTDAIDARVIADLVAQGKGWDFRDQEQTFEELRRLSFIYSKLWLDRNIQQNRLHCCIDQVFPEITMVLDVRRRTLREVLKKYQRPEEICAAGEAAFCDFVWQVSRGTEKRAKEVFALASESIGQSSLADIQEMSINLRNLDTIEADFEERIPF